MSNRPLQLGPDPDRTYMERWNEMHPDRYGRPDSNDEAEHARSQQGAANDTDDRAARGFSESLFGLAVLMLAPLTGAIATFLIYRWTAPDQLTTSWMLCYVGTFLVATWIGAMLVYALRRLLLAAAITGVTFGIGYLAWHLWLG